jgi:nickel transport protein
MIRAIAAPILGLLLLGGQALAHQLNVFVFVKDGMVIVENKFSNGNIPKSGEVRVLDADENLLFTIPLASDGTAQFPLDLNLAEQGLMIEVSTGEGHSNYWILTSEDIARGEATP